MKYVQYIKRRRCINDTSIFICMLLIAIAQRVVLDIFNNGIIMAILCEIAMIIFICWRINKTKKVNKVVECGRLVYGDYDKDYTEVIPYGGRGGASGNFRFGFNYKGTIYLGWIELSGGEKMVELIEMIKVMKMPILICPEGYYVMLKEFAIEEGIERENDDEMWIGNFVFGSLRYFVLMMSDLKRAFVLEGILVALLLITVIYIKSKQ